MKEKKQKTITILLVVMLTIIAINQYMLLTVSSVPRLIVVRSSQQQAQTATTQTSTGQETTSIEIPYSEQGYQQLLNFERTIQLSDVQKQDYVGLNVALPCCGFQTLQANGNCECGHHLAMSGLAKYMIQQGYSKAEVQAEIDKWKDVFYPGASSGSLGGC